MLTWFLVSAYVSGVLVMWSDLAVENSERWQYILALLYPIYVPILALIALFALIPTTNRTRKWMYRHAEINSNVFVTYKGIRVKQWRIGFLNLNAVIGDSKLEVFLAGTKCFCFGYARTPTTFIGAMKFEDNE